MQLTGTQGFQFSKPPQKSNHNSCERHKVEKCRLYWSAAWTLLSAYPRHGGILNFPVSPADFVGDDEDAAMRFERDGYRARTDRVLRQTLYSHSDKRLRMRRCYWYVWIRRGRRHCPPFWPKYKRAGTQFLWQSLHMC